LADFEIIYEYENAKKIKLSKDKTSGNLHIETYASYPIWGEIREKVSRYLQGKSQQGASLEDIVAGGNDERMLQVAFFNGLKNVFGENRNCVFFPASRNIEVNMRHQLAKIYGQLEVSTLTDNQNAFNSENEFILFNYLKHAEKLRNIFSTAKDFQGFRKDEEELGNTMTMPNFKKFLSKTAIILKGEYFSDTYGEKLRVTNKDYVYFTNASSGQQESLRMIQDIIFSSVRKEAVTKIYEEPESHLFPRSQKALLEMFVLMYHFAPESQIIVPTHSPYMLTALNNLMYASKTLAEKPAKKAEILKLVPAEELLAMNGGRFADLRVYFLRNGEFENMIDEVEGLIDPALLDEISGQMSETFNTLTDIRYE
jgi:predicted ATPase